MTTQKIDLFLIKLELLSMYAFDLALAFIIICPISPYHEQIYMILKVLEFIVSSY